MFLGPFVRSSIACSAAVHADGDVSAVDVPEVPARPGLRVVVPGGGGLDHLAVVLLDRFGRPVPHPTTLMKLTTRCGTVTVDGLNEALLAKAVRRSAAVTRVRVDTTVSRRTSPIRPTPVCWPRRSVGSPRPGSGSMPRAGGRTTDAGPVPRCGETGPCDRAKLRSRPRQGRGPGCGASRITLSSLTWPTPPPRMPTDAGQREGRCGKPGHAAPEGDRRPDPAAGRRRGRLARAVNDLDELLDATRGSPRRPGSGWPGSPRTARPGGSACTTPTPGRSRRAGSGSRSSSATKPRSVTTTTAIVLDHDVQPGNPADAPRLDAGDRAGDQAHRPETADRDRRPRLRRSRRRRRPTRPRRPQCRHSPQRQTHQSPASSRTPTSVPADT